MISAPADSAPATSAALHVAALRWLLLSPPLVLPPEPGAQLASFTDAERGSIAQWLCALELDSRPLLDWIAARPQVRIGRYAERLLEFYLTHGPLHRLCAAHIPLRSEIHGLKVTRGELDFLLTDTQGQHLHWELAVKFFLCMATGDTATPADFIGPNGVETLAHKWHKLFAQQLTHTPPPPWDAQTWQPQAYTRGWMFYRWGHAVPQCSALHAEHGKAWWADACDLAQLPDALYAFLPRLQWMAPLPPAPCASMQLTVLQRDAMGSHLQTLWEASGQAPATHMLAQLNGSSHDGAVQYEVARFFIRFC